MPACVGIDVSKATLDVAIHGSPNKRGQVHLSIGEK